MFQGLKNMGSLVKQAKEMKDKMKKVQEELKKMNFIGTALDNKIKITISGELEVVDVKIDPSVLKNVNNVQLEKAIKNAMEQAIKQSKDAAASQLSAVTGNLNIPGLM